MVSPGVEADRTRELWMVWYPLRGSSGGYGHPSQPLVVSRAFIAGSITQIGKRQFTVISFVGKPKSLVYFQVLSTVWEVARKESEEKRKDK